MLTKNIDNAPGSVAGQMEVGDNGYLAAPLLLQYWNVALRWKWIILGIIAASLIGGLILTLMMTPQYTATSRIEISREEKNITKVEGVDSSDARGDLEFYQTQYSLLEARSLAERVAKSLKLASRPDFLAAHGLDGGQDEGRRRVLTSAERAKQEKTTVGLLLGNVAISPIRASSLVDIKYTSASPQISAEIANAWTQQFIEASIDRKFSSTADARRFLEERLADLRGRLEQSERDAANYASRNGIVTLSTERGADGRTLAQRTLAAQNVEALSAALNTATAERIAAESRMRGASSPDNVQIASNPAIGALRQRRAEIAAEYSKLMVQFEPQYPAALALSQQMKTLDKNIAREEQRIRSLDSDGRKAAYQQAAQKEQDLARKVDALKAQLDTQERSNIQYNIYQREADTNRQLYDSLLQRYKEIGVAGVGANNIAIIDPAKVPEGPSAPNLPINLALAGLLGLALAAVATFALDQMDEGVREPAQIPRLLGLPLLGSIPIAENTDTLAELSDQKSEISEAYLSIRSNLAFSTDHGFPRSLMVTSTRPAEGKSTTSLALAAVTGRSDRRVLLVDGDLRSPSLNALLNLPNRAGLSNLLAGENNWRPLVHATSFKNVDFLSAGPLPPSAAELLSSDRLSQLMSTMGEHYDHIVVDSAPILGLADAPLVSRAVEGCVFVIEAEGVAVRGIKSALSRLQAVHANILGAVLTKLDQARAGYGYGYGYGYGAGKN